MQKNSSAFMLGLVAFFMVFREGAEIVIFLQSLLLAGNTPLQNFTGGLFGIALGVFFGLVFLRGSTQINLGRFFKVTSVILGVLALQLLAQGFHEFLEVGLLHAPEKVLLVLGFLSRETTGTALIAVMLFALMFMVIYDLVRTATPDFGELTAAMRRKKRYEFLREKYLKLGLSLLVTALAVPLFAPSLMASDVIMPKPIAAVAKGDVVTVAKPQKDGITRYEIDDMRFLVVKKGKFVRAGLDYCYICPPLGFGWDGEFLRCKNCSAPIAVEMVGKPGGCNPRVIDFKVHSATVTLSVANIRHAWEE